jgi:hypothetical protein
MNEIKNLCQQNHKVKIVQFELGYCSITCHCRTHIHQNMFKLNDIQDFKGLGCKTQTLGHCTVTSKLNTLLSFLERYNPPHICFKHLN